MKTVIPATVSRSKTWLAVGRQRLAASLGAGALSGLLVLLLFGAPAATAGGLLTNSDFSAAAVADRTWVAGWQAPASRPACYRWVDDDGFSGNTSLHYGAKEPGATGAVSQAVPCQKNTEYVLAAALKSDGTCLPMVRVYATDLGQPVVSVVADGGKTWKAYSVRFNSGGSASLQVQVCGDRGMADGQPGRAGMAAIDDVQIYAAAEAPAAVRPRDAFTPPGPNLALHKPYKLSRSPNYGYCTDPGDATQLTDGEYSVGYFWVQKTTVGWNNACPVQITLDLGRVEPIAGASYSTAAGVAGVTWPANISILVSADGQTWTYLGDLVRLTTKEGGPRADVYGTYRYATGDLKGAGRYVQLVVDQAPFTFVDEVEVYQGPPALLAQANPGPTTTDPLQLFRRTRVFNAVVARLRTDLSAAREAIGAAAGLPAADKANLLSRAEALAADVESMPEGVPDGFKAILPLNAIHAQIYALNAPLLRARGYRELTPWLGNRWDNLQPTEAPESLPKTPPSLRVQMMGNEYRAEAFNLTNPTDRELRLTVSITGLPGGANPAYISPREVLFTDSIQRLPMAAALPPAARDGEGFLITVPAGMTRQVWLAFHPTDVAPGTYTGEVRVSGAQRALALPLTLQLYRFRFPEQPSLAIGGWDYLEGVGAYDAGKTPQPDLIRCLREHFVNTPWAGGSVAPTGLKFGADGGLAATPDFERWDTWVAKWPGARSYAVFLSVPNSFNGEKMGTPRFNRMVGDWITAWVEHLQEQGLKPGQLLVLLVDEPTQPEQDAIILAWTKAIRAAQPDVVIWEDPCHADPYKANQEMLSSCTVLCPHRPRFIVEPQSYRDYFLAQQKAGRELAFYSCSAGKQADPIAYHRGQFWSAIKYNAKGCFYWAFCDEGGSGNSWNPYLAAGNGYVPMFIGPEGTTDGKHMEAIREGAEDYEYFQMLNRRVAELAAKGVQSPLLAQARTFMEKAPDEALIDAIGTNLGWNQPRDRSRMDRVRVEALDLLMELSKL